MKYNNLKINIPQEKRQEINNKILYVIDNNVEGITNEDIFNSYSGEGGLHGINYSDFNNYYDYSEAKKEVENGQFFTPHDLCQFIVDCIKPSKEDLIADLTCGIGNFFNYLPTESNIYGCELDNRAFKVAKKLYPEANIICKNILYYEILEKMDLIVLNPPFNIKWNTKDGNIISQLYCLYKSFDMLKAGGLLVIITPKSFLNDDFIDGNIIKETNKRFNFLGQVELDKAAFKSMGVENYNTKLMFFQKKSNYIEDRPYKNEFLEIKDSEIIHAGLIKPALTEKENSRIKIYLENLHSKDNTQRQAFIYQVKKLLFDIKNSKHTGHLYEECVEYFNKLYNQVKPEGMEEKAWNKIKVTETRVVNKLKKILKEQHKKEIDKIELVKTNYGLKLKAYSKSMQAVLNQNKEIVKKSSINDLVLNCEYPFEDQKYRKLIDKKIKKYQKQNLSFKDMEIPENNFVDNFMLFDKEKEETIILNDVQKNDMKKFLHKDYSIANWSCGGGKSLAGICFGEYQKEFSYCRNTFIICHALGINHWDNLLNSYEKDYINIKTLEDVNNIKCGQFVLISFYYLNKYKKQLKKYIKMNSNKIAVVVDESDELTSHTSNRTRVSLSIFRKAKKKFLTTGTTTRNNINELYSQLELLYNNSVNFINYCKYKYAIDKNGDYQPVKNEGYLKPFSAYHGNGLFRACFNPHRNTVLGIEKLNQDIYNIDQLTEIIEKTIITRTFKEIVGENRYSYKNIQVMQNQAEKEAYKVILEDFRTIVNQYFKSTGNSRKDSMLLIIRQIQLLIKACSTPQLLKEYGSNLMPNKFIEVDKLLKTSLKNEKVILGTIFLDSADLYYSFISKNHPDRELFLINGEINFKQRKSIIDRFEKTQNGILICTQQSLKSSVNIPSCNKVIVEALPWNIPRITQFVFRCVRFNSKDHTEIFLLTYANTIEQNQLALLMKKEKLNDYVRTLDFKEDNDIFNEHGIDLSILDDIIVKEKDKDGKVVLNLSWGYQKVS